ncbi:glycosyltransferase [Anaerosacchariphilus polymeriproducens]|nr:glycosyltransferase [Anaerosacchariphilus polymeriproducens]
MNPIVSISVLTYNHENYIRQALDSFLVQKTNFPFEILIHDDASTDKTQDIIREYQEKYPDKIFPICQNENQYSKGIFTVSANFNFPRARGKYIAFCEGDDYWIDMDKLQKQVDYMEGHEKCSMYIHAADLVTVNNEYIRDSRPFLKDCELLIEDVIDERELYPSASMLFRTDYVKTLPDFYYHAPVGDIPLHLYMSTKGYIYYKNEKMSAYRLGGADSWTTNILADKTRERTRQHNLKLQKMFEEFDEFTRFKYHEIVNYTIKRLQLGYLLDGEEFRKALSSKFKDQRRKELTKKEIFYIYFRLLIPKEVYKRIWKRN